MRICESVAGDRRFVCEDLGSGFRRRLKRRAARRAISLGSPASDGLISAKSEAIDVSAPASIRDTRITDNIVD
jgi:hypothetical protein